VPNVTGRKGKPAACSIGLMHEGRCFDPALCVAENGLAMDFLELFFALLESLELIEPLCRLVAWLFRSLFRLARWMMGSSEVSRGWVYVDQTRASRFAAEQRGMLHLSLTRRRRGKWQGASYVLR
jgi:hypothetical protein